MARKQKLINLHSFGTSTSALLNGPDQLTLGEIAVQHVDGEAKLHIRVSSGDTMVEGKLASFIDETAVDQKITTAKNDVNQRITDLSDKIGGNFDTTNTVAKAIADEQKAREDGDKDLDDAISALTDTVSDEQSERKRVDGLLSGETTNLRSALDELEGRVDGNEGSIDTIQGQLSGITGTVKDYVDGKISSDSLKSIAAATPASDYVTVNVGQKTPERTQTIGVSLKTVTLATASDQNEGLALAYDVKQVTDGLSSHMTSAETRLDAAEGSINTMTHQLSGFSTSDGAVKEYVDDAVSTAIASVYKVKGSVATYADLPSGATEGDVYNVQAAYGNYPAGTNWVWVGGDPGEWDALGGTIDLSPYMLVSDFNTYSATTKTKIEGIEGNITTLNTNLSTETTNRENADRAIEAKIGGEFTSENTVADAISGVTEGIEAEAEARDNGDKAIMDIIGSVTSANTVGAQLSTLRTDVDKVSGDLNTERDRATSAETQLRTDLDAEVSRATSAETALGNRITALSTAETELSEALAAEVSARTSADTQLQAAITKNADDIDGINKVIGNGFSEQSTVTAQLSAVKSTADNAVQGVTVKNTSTNNITATEDGTTHNVELDFDNMVIDCGTY